MQPIWIRIPPSIGSHLRSVYVCVCVCARARAEASASAVFFVPLSLILRMPSNGCAYMHARNRHGWGGHFPLAKTLNPNP